MFVQSGYRISTNVASFATKNRNTVQALLLPGLARRANIFHFILRKGYRNLIAFVLIKHPLGLFIE